MVKGVIKNFGDGFRNGKRAASFPGESDKLCFRLVVKNAVFRGIMRVFGGDRYFVKAVAQIEHGCSHRSNAGRNKNGFNRVIKSECFVCNFGYSRALCGGGNGNVFGASVVF